MSPDLLQKIADSNDNEKRATLRQMARTIRSSWEFVDVVFLVEGVSRAVAQQITRTRSASYAMQSMRVTDVRAMDVVFPPKADFPMRHEFDRAVRASKEAYACLVDAGMPLEDARGVLPINTACNIVCKYNLRNFADLVTARSSLRAQGEYADIAAQMRALVEELWPWAEEFFKPRNEHALEMLQAVVREIGLTTGSGPGWEIAKAIDLLKQEA